MGQRVFFYGTLMTAFDLPCRRSIDNLLVFEGHASIAAALFDLGSYPAALPASGTRVRGELYGMTDPDLVLKTLDEVEDYRPDQPGTSLYTRKLARVTSDDGQHSEAWVYFYNAPLGHARRIESGDYLQYLKMR